MGYKAAQSLTKSGYNQKQKNKKIKSSEISHLTVNTNNPIYKRYKKLYQNLNERYQSPRQSIIINSIMTRTHLGTRISSQQNRQLALLDIDKLISLDMGLMKQTDDRIHIMRTVVDMEGDRFGYRRNDNNGNNRYLFPRLQLERQRVNDLQNGGRIVDQRRLDEFFVNIQQEPRQNLRANPLGRVVNQNVNNNLMQFNQEQSQQGDQQRRTRQNRPGRNALGILRLVRAARMHYARMSQQLNNLQQRNRNNLNQQNTNGQAINPLENHNPVIVPQTQPNIQVDLNLFNTFQHVASPFTIQQQIQPQINSINQPQIQPLRSFEQIHFGQFQQIQSIEQQQSIEQESN